MIKSETIRGLIHNTNHNENFIGGCIVGATFRIKWMMYLSHTRLQKFSIRKWLPYLSSAQIPIDYLDKLDQPHLDEKQKMEMEDPI